MDEWIIVASSALRFFKFMQSITKKKHQTVSWASKNDKARIRLAFKLAYGRPPEDIELQLGAAYLSASPDVQNKLSLWESYAQVLLGSNEFMYLD